MPGPYVALQRCSKPTGDQLASSAPPCLEENEEGEDMKRSPRGLSKGGTGSTQAQHCLHPTSALILVHNLGLCLQSRASNQHTFTDSWAHRLRRLTEWVSVTGPQWYCWNWNPSLLTYIHPSASPEGPLSSSRLGLESPQVSWVAPSSYSEGNASSPHSRT